ncbi:SigE family RNA polymerase sigma factor [Micromonospora sp. NPDC047074]|uniref:SigE family RNA polymerase sigma factor n=1 Tax=Micromonospora sp. NPDC047074 TaxID=3154339 RepID=UPI0033C375B7
MASRDPLEEEFRDFVAARSGALLRTAYLLSGDWATAEDLLQTALTKTYLAWKRLGGIEAVEPYARRVMINTSTSWWRRRWHGERPTDVLPERAGVDEIEQQLDRDLLWRHLSALPSRQRAVLVLRFYEDMSEAQTAALLGISPGTVKSQTSRALGTLRRRMGAGSALGLPSETDPAPARPQGGAITNAGSRRDGTGRPATADGAAPVRPSTADRAPTMVVGADAAAVVAATNAPPAVPVPARPAGTPLDGPASTHSTPVTGPAEPATRITTPVAGPPAPIGELTDEPVPVVSGARAGAGSRTDRDEQHDRQTVLPGVPAGAGEHR